MKTFGFEEALRRMRNGATCAIASHGSGGIAIRSGKLVESESGSIIVGLSGAEIMTMWREKSMAPPMTRAQMLKAARDLVAALENGDE